jgi:hypothetical protein
VRAFHDEWVTREVGDTIPWQAGSYPYGGIEQHFRWGTVGSYLHPQDSGASIVITYGRAGAGR